MSMSVLEWIEMTLDPDKITKKEFKFIRNNGTKRELEEAIRKMEEMGGYESLSDE